MQTLPSLSVLRPLSPSLPVCASLFSSVSLLFAVVVVTATAAVVVVEVAAAVVVVAVVAPAMCTPP